MTQPTNRRFVMEPRLDAEVATINTQLNLKAPLASPALTGTPTSTTAAVDTSTTQIATTAFVTNQAAAATSPMDGTAAVGTSKRYARQDHVHPTDTTRAPLASPALTGTPTSTTAAADTNTTQIATTAYVVGQASSTAPVIDGTATVGTSLKYARADHVHPTDTSRAPAAGSSSITTVGTIASGTWQGTDVGLAYGGTNASLTAVNGGAVYSDAAGLAITAAGTSGQVLKSNGAAAPTWQTNNLDSLSDVIITTPSAGQTLAYNGTNWINGSGGGGGVTASATAPASPVNGSAWFDTNDGTLYVYYTDVNGSQWVEVQADSALGSQLATRMSTAESNITGLTAKDGLVPIVPTSVTVNVGSGSVAANGTITISGASSVTLNGIFSSTYNNYYIVSAFTSASADADIQSQLTGPSTLNAGYIGGRYGMGSAGVANTWYTTQGSATLARMSTSGGCSFQCVITNPGNTSYKRWLAQTIDNDFAMNVGFRNTTSAVAYTGMNLYTTTPTFGGTIKVYGYN